MITVDILGIIRDNGDVYKTKEEMINDKNV